MYPLLLLLAALGLTAIVLFVLLGRYADRGAKLIHADDTITELVEKLEEALEQQARLTGRVENLEAIVASEAWDAMNEEETTPPLALPEVTNEEEVARRAQRQRS